MNTHETHLKTVLGPLRAVMQDDVLIGLYFVGRPHETDLAPVREGEPARFARLRDQLDEYFAGRRRAFDVPIAFMSGTVFQREVWSALTSLQFGETVSYGALARRIGRPGAARAVGRANALNPISIVVPCHRVIGESGSLTGYAGGIENKRRLLTLEGLRELEEARA